MDINTTGFTAMTEEEMNSTDGGFFFGCVVKKIICVPKKPICRPTPPPICIPKPPCYKPCRPRC